MTVAPAAVPHRRPVRPGAWGARRHRATLAWSRELETAFRTDERRDLPRHRLF